MVKLNTGPKIAECSQFVQMELDRFDAIYAMLVITQNESPGEEAPSGDVKRE